LAKDFVARFILGGDKSRSAVGGAAIEATSVAFLKVPVRKDFARALIHASPPRAELVNYRGCGQEIHHEAVLQIDGACPLPVPVTGVFQPRHVELAPSSRRLED
jgi:hypothetical protein